MLLKSYVEQQNKNSVAIRLVISQTVQQYVLWQLHKSLILVYVIILKTTLISRLYIIDGLLSK